jgi:hypothetical protein
MTEIDTVAYRTVAATAWQRSAALRRAAGAGAIAGVISAGIGSRIAMRIITLLNDEQEGTPTDANAVVGEVTFEGTLQLLILGAILGVAGGLVYLGLRRWLWVPAPWRGVAYGALSLVTVGHVLFDTHNVDFQIFEPILVVIALFAALFLVNGVIVAAMLDRLHPGPPPAVSTRVPRAVAAGLAVIVMLGSLLMADTIMTMVDDAGTCFAAAGGGEGCAVLTSELTQ